MQHCYHVRRRTYSLRGERLPLRAMIKSRTCNYHRYHPDDIPIDFPNREEVFVLQDVYHTRGGPFQRLLDCGGIRYVLLIEYNKDVENCMENTLLEKMYEGFEWRGQDVIPCFDTLEPIPYECMKLFWPYLNKDFQTRIKNGTLMDPICFLDYDRKDSHKLQLKTIDGSVCAIEHDTHLDNRHESFHNSYPDLCCFPKSEAEILETITFCVLRVRIRGEEYALKAGRSDLECAIRKLHAAPNHPNVLSLSGVLVDDEGKIMGMLTPFFSGELLSCIRSAMTSQKEKWKTQISDAINSLHDEDIIWGDAKPDNIIISSDTDEAKLIDFEGGRSEGWVDEDLCNTVAGDMQALSRILKFVDDIPTSEEGS